MIKPQINKLKAKFQALDGKKRENLVRGIVIVGGMTVLLAMYYGMNKDDHQPAAVKEESAAVIELGDERLEDDIRAQVEREREEANNKNKKQDEDLARTKEELESQRKQVEALSAVINASTDPANALPPPGSPPDPLASGNKGAPNDPVRWAMNNGPSGEDLAAELKVEYVGGIGRPAAVPIAATAQEAEKKKRPQIFSAGQLYAREGLDWPESEDGRRGE